MAFSDWLQNVGTAIGAIGGLLGGWSWWRANKIQKYTLEALESDRINQKIDDYVYAALVKEAESAPTQMLWNPEPGSERFQIMERLVDKGKMKRYIRGFVLNRSGFKFE